MTFTGTGAPKAGSLPDRRRLLLALVFTAAALFATANVFGFGKKETPKTAAPLETEDAARPLGQLTVSGRVRLVGTALFSQLVITDAQDNDWYIDDAERKKLALHEQRTVTVTGKAFVQEMILANGRSAGKRYMLRDIQIKNGP